MIAIIDYGAGNLRSVQKALQFIGASCNITGDAGEIARASGVILPGVGAFGDCMESMRARGLVQPVREAAEQAIAGERPFLGICLGLQLLFAASQESPGVRGLDVLPGEVAAIPSVQGRKVPHMGWNSIAIQRKDGLFAGLPQDAYVYFVHSFYVQAAQRSDVAAQTDYGVTMDAAVVRGLLTAAQFHPEKSGETGLLMLRNFLELTK